MTTAWTIDAGIANIATDQGSAFSREQAIAVGLTDPQLARWVRDGRISLDAPGVYTIAGGVTGWANQLWVACLAAGPLAVVSFEAAAAVHGFTGFPRGRPVITLPHPAHARIRGVTVHQLTDIGPEWCVSIPGLPLVTSPARTFVDIAAVSRRARVRVALEDASSARIVSRLEVGRALHALTRRGKPGVRMLAALLDEYTGGKAMPQSYLERMLFGLIADAGLPPPTAQMPHPGRERVRGCVDGGYDDIKLILEADGRPWHERIRDVARDRHRDNEAAAAGYLTLRFLHEHVANDPDGTLRIISDTRADRLALFSRQ